MRKAFIYLILFLTGLGIIIAIFGVIGFAKIWQHLLTIGCAGFLIYFLASLVSLGLTGLGWWLFARSYRIRISLLRGAVAHLIAFGMNMLIPSMYIGGEPFRAYYIGQISNTPKNNVFATAIFAKYLEIIAFLLYVYFGTVVLVIQNRIDAVTSLPFNDVLIAIDVIAGIILLATFWGIIRNVQFLTKTLQVIRKLGIFAKLLDNVIPKVRQMEEAVSRAFRHNWRMGFLVMFFGLISVGITFVKPAIIFYFLHSGAPEIPLLSLSQLALIFIITQILISIHITPGGMGLVEGGNILFFQEIGISPDIAAAYLLMTRFIDFFLAGTGCFLMVQFSLLRLGREKATTVERITTITQRITTISEEKPTTDLTPPE